MSQKKTNRSELAGSAQVRRRKAATVIAVALILIGGSTMLAYSGGFLSRVSQKHKSGGVVSVASMDPANPAKEYIYGGKLLATEEPSATCTYSISPTSASFTASGGPGSVSVTTGAGCTWTATSNATWVTITSGSSGTMEQSAIPLRQTAALLERER